MKSRIYKVTVKRLREYSATIAIRARGQAEADRKAIAAYYKWACEEESSYQVDPLGFPWPWNEHDSIDHEPEIDTRFRCVDCGKDTSGGEYYMVGDDVWAASRLAPHGGMLCLACLERRIGRPLTEEDFTALWPDVSVWQRHIAARAGCADPGPQEQLDAFH